MTVTPQDKNVYLLGEITSEQLKSGATVKVGDVQLDLSKANSNYGLESWQTDYVNIKVTVKDGDTVITDKLSDLTAQSRQALQSQARRSSLPARSWYQPALPPRESYPQNPRGSQAQPRRRSRSAHPRR